MPFYNLKRDCKVYLVTNDTGILRKYRLDVYPDLTFSQTFNEQAVNVKTLHDQNAMFEGAVINKANPANFSFTVLLKNSTDLESVVNQLVKRNTSTSDGSVEALYSADLYIDTGVEVYRLTKAVFERGTFQISKDAPVTVSLEGSASKLSRFGNSGVIIPGTSSSVAATILGVIPRFTRVDVDGVELANIASISLELSNQVQWIDYDTLHKSLYASSPSGTMYPEAFVVSNKILSGTIVQYLTDTNSTYTQSWRNGSSLRIRTGNQTSPYDLDINIPAVVFTNRIQTDDIFTQIYDFRMTANTAGDVINIF